MSLSWLEGLSLFLHPRRVVLERRPWRGPSCRQEFVVPVPAANVPGWQPALARAVDLLETLPRGAALRIVVADHFVRYALLPWSSEFVSRKARLELARGLMRSSLGEREAGLDVALDAPVFGQEGLAAGIERELLDALRAAARRRRLRLSSVQPRLVAELSLRRQQLRDGCFVSLDRDWLSLVELQAGQLLGVRNHRAADAGTGGLPRAEVIGLLSSLPLRGDVQAGRRLYVVGADAWPSVSGWQTTCWPALFAETAHA